MTPSVSENPELRLKDSKGNPLVIAIVDVHTGHWSPSSEVIQAVAIVPDDSRDPVDLVLKVSLRCHRDDPFHLDGTSLMELTPDSYGLITPDRRYSITKVYGPNIVDQTVDVAIIRGELNAVVEASAMSREEGVLLRYNANMHHGCGHRSMGVALTPIDKDGNIIGEFISEGLVAMGLRKLDEVIAENKKGSGPWVEVHLWGWALRVQHWLNLVLMLVMTFVGWYIMQLYLTERIYDDSAAGSAMGYVRFAHFLTGFLRIAAGLWCVILLFVIHGR